MSLFSSVSSGTNCEWTFIVIHESLIAFPVDRDVSLVSCLASRACSFAVCAAAGTANPTAATRTDTASMFDHCRFGFIVSLLLMSACRTYAGASGAGRRTVRLSSIGEQCENCTGRERNR